MITGLSLYQREILRKNRKTNPVSQLEQVGGGPTLHWTEEFEVSWWFFISCRFCGEVVLVWDVYVWNHLGLIHVFHRILQHNEIIRGERRLGGHLALQPTHLSHFGIPVDGGNSAAPAEELNAWKQADLNERRPILEFVFTILAGCLERS